MNYRDTVLKKRLRIKTKFKYFRRGFLKYLNYTLLVFKYFRKSIRLFLFKRRQSLPLPLSLSNKNFIRKRKTFFRNEKISSLLRFNLSYLNSCVLYKKTIKEVRLLRNFSNVYPHFILFRFPVISANKKLVFYKANSFLRTNNLRSNASGELISSGHLINTCSMPGSTDNAVWPIPFVFTGTLR